MKFLKQFAEIIFELTGVKLEEADIEAITPIMKKVYEGSTALDELKMPQMPMELLPAVTFSKRKEVARGNSE